MKLLLVEDEALLRHHLATRFAELGHVVDAVADAEEGLYRAQQYNHDIAIIDLGLPGMGGLDLIRELRSMDRSFPILILTARGNWQDKVEGLTSGADDYVVKPFAMSELSARVRAVLRRLRPGLAEDRVRIGDIVIDRVAHRVKRNGKEVHLGPTEFRLLDHFMQNPGRVFSREQLLDAVWGSDVYVEARTVDVHVGRLRKALNHGEAADPIRTVRSAGYALDLEV